MSNATNSAKVVTGWSASLNLQFESRENRTVLSSRSHSGPLTVQRPFYPDGQSCHVYMLHPPGGVVGGDELCVDVSAGPKTNALVTTPGASKFYRSNGSFARQRQYLAAAAAALHWLPQENIHYSGALVSMETKVELIDDARLVLWDIHCFGRPASRAPFDHGEIDATVSVVQDGSLLFHERQRTTPRTLQALAFMAGRSVSGMLVISRVGTRDVSQCQGLMDVPNATCAVTQIDRLLVARYLGDSAEQAKQLFIAVWKKVAASQGQTVGELPRIWKT